MRNEIEYKMFVEQPVHESMERMEEAATHFGITADELNRAVFNWVMERIQAGGVPEWMLNDLGKITEEE